MLPPQSLKSSRDSLFAVDADLVLLAASSNSVGVEQARAIRARVVVEGSNFGLTDAGRGVLQEMGVCVIPDLIASSSSAAMVARQMQAQGRLPENDLWSAIETAIDEATASALDRSRQEGTDVRTAYLRAHGA